MFILTTGRNTEPLWEMKWVFLFLKCSFSMFGARWQFWLWSTTCAYVVSERFIGGAGEFWMKSFHSLVCLPVCMFGPPLLSRQGSPALRAWAALFALTDDLFSAEIFFPDAVALRWDIVGSGNISSTSPAADGKWFHLSSSYAPPPNSLSSCVESSADPWWRLLELYVKSSPDMIDVYHKYSIIYCLFSPVNYVLLCVANYSCLLWKSACWQFFLAFSA